MSTIIEVKNLGKKYRIGEKESYLALRDKLAHPLKAVHSMRAREDYWALQDINFKVEQGEVLGIIGRNGAGKSTLLKILSKITPPTTGEVRLRGRVGSLLEVGTGFHPELTGRENIYLSGSVLGMRKKEIEKKFDEIVDFAGVEKFLDTPVKHYSSGMQVRLGFAVAAHLEPEILIVDEVLAVGDAEFQKKCLGKMEDVTKKNGRTVLFVSHNMAAVEKLCQKCILLDRSHLVGIGETKDIIEQYSQNNKTRQSKIAIAPEKDKKAFFTAFYLTDDGGNNAADFKMGQAIHVQMNFTVKENGMRLNPSIHVYNQYQECLFASSNLHTSEGKLEYKSGTYNFKCIIPGNFFNEGNYHISFILSENFYEVVDRYEQAISFEIIDDLILRGDFTGHWIGLVKPKLDWKLEKI